MSYYTYEELLVIIESQEKKITELENRIANIDSFLETMGYK